VYQSTNSWIEDINLTVINPCVSRLLVNYKLLSKNSRQAAQALDVFMDKYKLRLQVLLGCCYKWRDEISHSPVYLHVQHWTAYGWYDICYGIKTRTHHICMKYDKPFVESMRNSCWLEMSSANLSVTVKWFMIFCNFMQYSCAILHVWVLIRHLIGFSFTCYSLYIDKAFWSGCTNANPQFTTDWFQNYTRLWEIYIWYRYDVLMMVIMFRFLYGL
jgi:hypothetical protein